MKIVSVALRSLNGHLSHRFQQTHLLRKFSASPWTISDNSPDKSEQRIFGENPGRHSKIDSYLEKLKQPGNTQDRPSSVDGGSSRIMHDLEESIENTLSDGMDGRLKEAAAFFEFDQDEIDKEDYAFRYDTNFYPGHTYTLKDLDLTKPASPPKGPIMGEFTVTTKEVLSQADFRNVRFLANFITEAGILIKRSKTGISAKAQRKVAREIKTARAFGLMPFTTMGTKSFVFGKTMETLDDDYAYRTKSVDVHGDPDIEDIA